jgi:hypothetical protein
MNNAEVVADTAKYSECHTAIHKLLSCKTSAYQFKVKPCHSIEKTALLKE